MKKFFLVSSDIKIFIVLRSVLTGALVSLLVFFLYFFFSPVFLIPVLIFLGLLNFWLIILTTRKLASLGRMTLYVLDSGIEFDDGRSSHILPWKDIQKVESSYTPLGTRNTLVLFTKEKNHSLHLYDNVDLLWEYISKHLDRSTSIQTEVKIWGKEMQLLSTTIFCFLLLMMMGNLAMGPTDFGFAYFIALTVGLFFILYRPFSQLISESITQVEVGLGTLCTLAFIFNFTSTVILPILQQGGQNLTAACGSESPQILCYAAPQKTCQNVWRQMEAHCKVDLKEYLQTRSPSSLIGPVLSRCQKQKYDRSLYFNRINTQTSLCQNYFASIAAKPSGN